MTVSISIKRPTTIEEQIKQLKERGLYISDEYDLRRWLNTVGYYRLSGYWWMYEEHYPNCAPRTHTFVEGTTWTQVKQTYIFDQKFRRLISIGIEKIEIAVKALWAQYLATHYNTSHPHEDTNIFKSEICSPSQESSTETAFDKLVRSYQKSNETFAKHYREKYKDFSTPPIWVSALFLTLGELLNWIHGIKSKSDKRAIFSIFSIDYRPMLSILNHLRWVRNVCAHNGRLWNKRTPLLFMPVRGLQDRLIFSSLDTSKLDSKIYNTIIVMSEILKSIDPEYPFVYFIKELILHSKHVNPKMMGFPNDWLERKEWMVPVPLPKQVQNNKRKLEKV